MSGRPLLAASLVLLAALPALPSATPEPFPPTWPWWNETGMDKGFHLRALVHVRNPHPFPLQNAPVAAEIDVLRLLADAGWPALRTAVGDQLKSFQLDPNSIRVVPLVDAVSGRLKTVHSDRLLQDPARYEAPSAAFNGTLVGQLASPFNPRINPYVTVVWRVPERLDPNQTVSYMVYFDTLTNGAPHPPPRYNGTLPAGSLQSVFWSGEGLTLYGVVTATGPTSAGTVTVVSLHPFTNVTVYAA
ncbi:MAG TPA: hypothetical protein VHI93_02005, partial [Candidatus Thermoplasmatota archaeon]|nr:hypothetical protein [Candidatus Thermoplasmatota archaeon]